ncbi:MAG: tail fiber domain-containing protein [Candidatus Udaeobacter sp.]
MKTLITSQNSLLTILRSRITLILVALIFGAFVPAQMTQAVGPPPDGGYAGGNTAEGQAALFGLTSGTFNTAAGFLSLRTLTEGNFNTGMGAGTLFANTADQNTATGAAALLNNTIGSDNTANGAFALLRNTEGTQNTANGFQALSNNTTGNGNVAIGVTALLNNTTGSGNVAIGLSALSSSTGAGSDTTDGANVAIGPGALQNTNGSGTNNGGGNNAVGQDTLRTNTTGFANNAFGVKALFSNTTAVENTAFGDNALLSTTVGGGNTAIGALALKNNTTGVTNTAVGFNAGFNVTTANNIIVIGTNVGGQNVDHGCFIGEIFGQTSSSGSAVFINSEGRLGTATSSRRFKDSIKPMDNASESLFALKPVTFRYKKEIDSTRTPQLGLVAEDVEKVNPDLVVRDKEGKPYTVRYDQVNAMLLNEFLKEHRKNEEQENTMAELKSGMTALAAMVKEQESLIQKVSAQLATASRPHGGLEASKSGVRRIREGGPAPQVVNNP